MQSTATPTLTSCDVFQVQPVLVKKQPKFPSRERHMAIRRKKSMAPPGGSCEKCSDERWVQTMFIVNSWKDSNFCNIDVNKVLDISHYRNGISLSILASLTTANNQRQFGHSRRRILWVIVPLLWANDFTGKIQKRKSILIEHQSLCRIEEKVEEIRKNCDCLVRYFFKFLQTLDWFIDDIIHLQWLRR